MSDLLAEAESTSGPVAGEGGENISESHRIGHTRISATWVAVVAAAIVLALLLVFILQNTRSVKVSYFTASGTAPLGVALLFAVIGGLLLAGVVASLRIVQLRRSLSGQAKASTPPHRTDESIVDVP